MYRCVGGVCSIQKMEHVAVKTFWCRVEGRIDGLTSEMFDVYFVSFGSRVAEISLPSG